MLEKRYLRRVAREIPLGGKRKRAFLAELAASIREYLAEHPNATEATLSDRFGTPNAIADQFYAAMSYEELRSRIKRGKAVLLITVCTAVILILSTWGLYTKLIYDNMGTPVIYIDTRTEEYQSFETKDDVRKAYPELSEELIEKYFPDLP